MQIIDMNRSGDTRQEFDMADSAQVELAMSEFSRLVEQGKFASVPSEDGHSGRMIREFDPSAKTILFRNQNVGG